MKILVVVLALIVTLILSVISWFVLGGDQIDGAHVRWFIGLSIAAGIAYLVMIWAASKSRYSIESSNRLWTTLLVLAFAARFVVAFGAGEQTWLSDDVYRYVWEGKLVNHEMNPFAISPEQLKNSGLADDSIFPNVDHPWLPTIYPPLSQYLFAVAYRLGGDSVFGFKLLAFIFELLTAIMILRFAREMHLPRWSSLVYLFCPLVFIEFIISSHVDIFAIPFLLMFLMSSSIRKPKPVVAGLWLAAAAMIKLPALLFALPLLFGYNWRDRLKLVGAVAVLSAALYLPFLLTAGPNLFQSMWGYLGDWQFNASIFKLFSSLLGDTAALIVCGVLFAGSAVYFSWKRRRCDRLHTMFLVYGAYIVFASAVFPWYLVWLLPFLVINRNPAFLLLTVTIGLSYHVLIGHYGLGAWDIAGFFQWLEYLPFYALLAYSLYKRVTCRAMKLA